MSSQKQWLLDIMDMQLLELQWDMAFFIADKKLENLYPMNTFFKNKELIHTNSIPDEISIEGSFDLRKIGKTTCPEYIRNIVLS